MAIDPPPAPISIISMTGMRMGKPLPRMKRAARPTSKRREVCGRRIVDQADLGGGAAHVEGDELLDPALMGHPARQHGAAAGPRFHQTDGKADGGLQCRHAAAGGHQQQGASDTFLAQGFRQLAQVFFHQRPDEGIGHGRAEAVELADLRADLAGEADREMRVALFDPLTNAPLMGGIGIAVEQADPDALGPRRGQIVEHDIEGRFVERQEDVAPDDIRSGTV